MVLQDKHHFIVSESSHHQIITRLCCYAQRVLSQQISRKD